MTMMPSQSDIVIGGLVASSNLSKETGHPGPDIRPCIALLSESSRCKADFPNRNEAALIIASELNRIGKGYEEASRFVERWNRSNQPPLKPNELEKAIRNGYSGKYNYGCRNANLEVLCIGERCPFNSRTVSSKRRCSNITFHQKGWQRHLCNRLKLIYLGLPYLEVKRQVGVGGRIYANHKQIADACGVSPRRLGDDLTTLAQVGLIEYKPGAPRKWEGRASEIKRVIPIPGPTAETLRILRKQ